MSMKQQRKFHSLGLVCILAALCMFVLKSGPAAASGDYKLRHGGQYYPEEFLLKGDPGLWKKYDLSMKHILFSSGTENNQALISGSLDTNVGSDTKTVSLFTAIPDKALIICTVQRGNRYSTIVRKDSKYKTWHDLKGKKVGTRLGSGAEQVLLRYFEKEKDLAWTDFEWVNLKTEDMIAALMGGSVEAFTVWEPTPAIAEAQGIGRVIRSYGDIAQVPVSLHTTQEFAKNNRETLVRFLASLLDRTELINEDPEKAAKYAAKAASARGIQVDPDAFLRIFKRVNFSLEIDDSVVSAYKDTAAFLKKKGKIKQVPKFTIDRSILQEAKTIQKK